MWVGVSCVMYDLLSCALAEEGVDGLPIFATELSKFLCYSTARELATVIFGDSALSGSCIASWCVGCGVWGEVWGGSEGRCGVRVGWE